MPGYALPDVLRGLGLGCDMVHRKGGFDGDEGNSAMAALNIVDVRWFSGKGTVGVVLIKTTYSGYKAYIGVGLDVNEDYDAEFICAWGTKLPRRLAMAYWPKLIKEGVLYDGRKTDKRRKSRKNIDGEKPAAL